MLRLLVVLSVLTAFPVIRAAKLRPKIPVAMNATQPVPQCLTPDQAKALVCSEHLKKQRTEVLLNETLADIDVANISDWRVGLKSMAEMNSYMLKEQLFTDCTFIVGRDNTTEEIHAHRLFLQRASPVFEAIFTAEDKVTRPLRVPDVTPDAFRRMLESIYTGDTCIRDFDEACELTRVAARFQLPSLALNSRAYVWSAMYPGNVWRAYACGAKLNDTQLTNSALQMTQRRTNEALTDHKFVDISFDALEAFLAQDALNISSEVRLYEASLRWAMAETARQGLPQNPETLRKVLGHVIRHIRFLQMTPAEFANVESTFKLLSYSESLSIIFNLNSPGVMTLPPSLSSVSRNRSSPSFSTFYVIGSPNNCSKNSSTPDTFDVLTTTVMSNKFSRTFKVLGVQIPARKRDSEVPVECSTTLQHFTVLVMDAEDRILHECTRKEEVRACDNAPQGWQAAHARDDWKLVNVKFNNTVVLTNYGASSTKQYKFKVVFHNSGTYPSSVGTESFRSASGSTLPFVDTKGYYWLFGSNEFVFAMITENMN